MKIKLDRLRDKFDSSKIDGLLIFKPQNRTYLSGFTGSTAVLYITTKDAFLITDFRYTEQARDQAANFQVIEYKFSLYETLKDIILKSGSKKVGFEREFLTYLQFEILTKQLNDIKLVPIKDIVEELRIIKETGELQKLRKAVQIADSAYQQILTFIKHGISEIDISVELEFTMRKLGAEKSAFDIIIASGQRSSLPHGVATDKIIENGDCITMDFGAVYQGYHSDMTRTVFVGSVTEKQREIYDIVLNAQLLGIKAVAPGKIGRDVDASAREYIKSKGYGDNFGHGLGHGVGLEIHENPRLSLNSGDILEEGMAVTVEPGIYIPNWGGIRIEDTTIVSSSGCEVLNTSAKELIIIK